MSNKTAKRKKSAVEMLLKLLLDGDRIEHQGYTYAMASDGSLCMVLSDDTGYKIECDLSSFKKLADDIGKDELWLKCCANKLKDLK